MQSKQNDPSDLQTRTTLTISLFCRQGSFPVGHSLPRHTRSRRLRPSWHLGARVAEDLERAIADCTRHHLSYHYVVPSRIPKSSNRCCTRFRNRRRCLWRLHSLWCRISEQSRRSRGVPMALHHRGTHHGGYCACGHAFPSRLPSPSSLVKRR